jgi:hypothetical protein
MEVIEMVINENSERQGVYAVSVVEYPAIEENWVALNKEIIELKSVDDEKRILMGAALIPNKKILRRDKKLGEYMIYFTEETIRKTAELFLVRSNQNNATIEHQKEIDGMSVVESWIIEDIKLDKSQLYNFELPVGTWMISMKVYNDEIWNKVKAGEIKGFSIEGIYEANQVQASKDELMIEQIKELLKNL